MMASSKIPKFIVADSESNADLLYATRFFAPDAFLLLDLQGEKRILLNDLEIDRGKRTAKVDHVESWSQLAGVWKKRFRQTREPLLEEVAVEWLRQHRVRKVRVPFDFPSGVAFALQAAGVKIEISKSFLYPEREFKTPSEIRAIREAIAITESGMQRGMEVLTESTIGPKKRLIWRNETLSSERLRGEIDAAMVKLGGTPQNTIVAGGNQACDPHERGHGPLRADELIILDLFPRVGKSGFYGDLTRTVVRGRAGEAQRALWQTVLDGQIKALQSIRPGANGLEIHELIKADFATAGYPTEIRNGRRVGFFHGTGHGLGLELHESPRFGATIFQKNQVFTVEPGIYWPGVGGVRHEDVVQVTAQGAKLLSSFPKFLEI